MPASRQRGGDVPDLRHLPHPFYEWRSRGRALRAGGVDAQGPAPAAAAQRHADPCRQGAVDPGRGRADARLPPVRRPARRPRLPRSARRPCRSCSSTTGSAAGPNGSPGPPRSPRRRPGWSTDAGRVDEPFGFCHYAARPGDLVAMDSFYIGNLKGVGKVYQLTAIDTATRWAIMLIVLGPVTAEPHDPVHRPRHHAASGGSGCRCGRCSPTTAPSTRRRASRATSPPRASPTTASRPAPRTTTPCANGSKAPPSRSAGDPAFHRRRFTSIRQLQAEADTWLQSTTTTAAATTATTCAAAPPPRSSTTTARPAS